MLRFIGWLLATLMLLALLLSGAAWYLLRDPNELKPELTALIESQTGVPVTIDGDLAWRLWPPLTLSARAISANYEGSAYSTGRLSLDLDLRSVISSRDLDQWRVNSLEVEDLVIESPTDRTEIADLTLSNFAIDTPSPFKTRLRYQSGDEPPVPLTAAGQLTYRPASNEVLIRETRFETDLATGVCNLDTRLGEASGLIDAPDAIIPTAIWRSVDWDGNCVLERLLLEDQTFENVRIELANEGGASATNVEIPRFFGGSAIAQIDIDAAATPVRWRIEPDLHEVDSQALMGWLDQRLEWVAPLAYGGAVTMTGNTERELVASIRGKTAFNGGKGRIDVTRIKQPLLALATLIREDEHIQKWPEIWQYERLIGEWDVDGTAHTIALALDNLTAAIEGDYDPLSDALDMRIDILFEDNPGMHSFDMSPLLVGLPIPMRCTGSLEAPKCRVDDKAAQRIVTTALAGQQGDELKAKLNDKIDKEVPEEYRDAAKDLLDIFSRSLQQKSKPDG